MPLTILSEEGAKLMEPIIVQKMVDKILMSFDVLRRDAISQQDHQAHFNRIRHLCSDLQSIATQLSNQKFKPNGNEVKF